MGDLNNPNRDRYAMIDADYGYACEFNSREEEHRYQQFKERLMREMEESRLARMIESPGYVAGLYRQSSVDATAAPSSTPPAPAPSP